MARLSQPDEALRRARGQVLGSFDAGHPRGSWPAEEFAAQKRAEGVPVEVVMDMDTGRYYVKAVW